MSVLAIIIKKVAEQASKIVLLGALVGGVSMMSYATETTAGPTIEKAQLETVHINLDAVVEAISKVDPGWVESLPKMNRPGIVASKSITTVAKSADTEYYWYFVNTAGEIVLGSEAFDGELTSQADAEANPPCLPGNTSDCIRGFLSPIPAQNFPTSATGQATPLQKD